MSAGLVPLADLDYAAVAVRVALVSLGDDMPAPDRERIVANALAALEELVAERGAA